MTFKAIFEKFKLIMSFSVLDIESCCRVCLSLNDSNLSIYDEVQEFDLNISDLLTTYADMTISTSDVYPKIICEECLRELLVVAKFKEKVKHSEDTFSRLICDGKVSTSDLVSNEPIEESSTVFNYIKEEDDINVDDAAESYEEVEFLDLTAQNESISGVHVVAIDKSDDGYIDEIIEECSLVESDTIADGEDDQADDCSSRGNETKTPKQTSQTMHLSPSASKVIINFNCVYCGAEDLTHKIQICERDLVSLTVGIQTGFMHSNNLKKHMTSHVNTSVDPFAIDYDSTAIRQLKLEEITEPHSSTDKTSKQNRLKPHKCEHCDRAFVSRSLLLSHTRTHTGERPFACNQCDKNFATQGGLDLHTRRHLGLKNYVCNICDRRFVESSNLKVHMRTHTGERPHRCNRCSRSFSRVFLLQIHQRTHTGERPFECETCHKCFAQQGDLSAHKRIHSGEKPHKCTICNKAFIKSSALTSHKRRHTEKVIYDDLSGETQNTNSGV